MKAFIVCAALFVFVTFAPFSLHAQQRQQAVQPVPAFTLVNSPVKPAMSQLRVMPVAFEQTATPRASKTPGQIVSGTFSNPSDGAVVKAKTGAVVPDQFRRAGQ